MKSSKIIGNQGENVACKYIEKIQNKKIIARNYHSKYGEIDIISCDDKYINFIEVKTRKYNNLVGGFEAIDRKKQNRIIKTAEMFLADNPYDLQPKFDAVEIIFLNGKVSTINYISDAFYTEEYDEFF